MDVPHLDAESRFRATGMPLFVRRWRHHGRVAPHTHAASELVVVLAGAAEHEEAGGSRPIRAGDVLVIHPPARHGYREARGLEIVNIVFDRGRLAPLLTGLQELPGFRALWELEPQARRRGTGGCGVRLSAAELTVVEPLLTRLAQELKTRGPGYRALAGAMLVEVLVVLARAYAARPSAQGARLLRLAQLVQAIETAPQLPWTVPGCARRCGLSPSAVTRAFRAAVGTTPTAFVIRTRVRRAAAALVAGEQPITAIALAVGFQDPTYFARQFRRIMGTSARTFRAQAAAGAALLPA